MKCDHSMVYSTLPTKKQFNFHFLTFLFSIYSKKKNVILSEQFAFFGKKIPI